MHNGHSNKRNIMFLGQSSTLILGKVISIFVFILIATKPTCCIFKVNDPYS